MWPDSVILAREQKNVKGKKQGPDAMKARFRGMMAEPRSVFTLRVIVQLLRSRSAGWRSDKSDTTRNIRPVHLAQ